jgi:CHASE2 domain-containing sensor protein
MAAAEMTLRKVSEWPMWLQWLILVPNGLLASVMCWVWWPKSDREWRRFGILAAYLIAFYSTLYLVFGFK